MFGRRVGTLRNPCILPSWYGFSDDFDLRFNQKSSVFSWFLCRAPTMHFIEVSAPCTKSWKNTRLLATKRCINHVKPRVYRCFRCGAQTPLFTRFWCPTENTEKHMHFVQICLQLNQSHVFSRVFSTALKHHYLRWFRAIHTKFQGCVYFSLFW